LTSGSTREPTRGPTLGPGAKAHGIGMSDIAALIMMALADVLTRLVIIYLRGRRLTASAPAPIAPIAGGVGA
jgi:hypothetical protein